MLDDFDAQQQPLPIHGKSSPLDSTDYGLDAALQKMGLSSSVQLPDYAVYSVQSGDTLWDIAKDKTDNPFDYQNFREADGSDFTDQEARQLQIGDGVFIPLDLLTGLPLPVEEIAPTQPDIDFSSKDPVAERLSEKYIAYTVKPNDTLWDIAQANFGEPLSWVAILDDEGNSFDREEAKVLRIDDVVWLPKGLDLAESSNKPEDDILILLPDPITYSPDGVPIPLDGAGAIIPPIITQPPIPDPPVSDPLTENPELIPSGDNDATEPEIGFANPKVTIPAQVEGLLTGTSFPLFPFRTTIVNDEVSGNFSLEARQAESTVSATQALEFSPDAEIFKKIIQDFEVQLDGIFKVSGKFDGSGNAFSLKVGSWRGLDVWAASEGIDINKGRLTTPLKLTVEGDITKTIDEANLGLSEGWQDVKVGVELSYLADLAWEALPLPTPPVFEFAPVKQLSTRVIPRPVVSYPRPGHASQVLKEVADTISNQKFELDLPKMTGYEVPVPEYQPTPLKRVEYNKDLARNVDTGLKIAASVAAAGATVAAGALLVATAPAWVTAGLGAGALAGGAAVMSGVINTQTISPGGDSDSGA